MTKTKIVLRVFNQRYPGYFVDKNSSIKEIDLNPNFASFDGDYLVDTRMVLK
jgi:hypothetical protein